MHSKLLAPAWRWTIKAMVKAGLLPGIGHYELHLRDRLCDAVRGTPLANMRRLHGWQRVDQSKEPTVPRGIVEGLFDHSFVDEESRRTGPAQEPHSSLAAEVAAAGSSRADKDRERKRKRRKNMTTEERAEAARKCKWRSYNKMPGSTFDYDAWKSNGEPTRPPPPPNLG